MSELPDIPRTVGALLIGGLFASLLAGMVNLQTIFYYRSYKTKDPLLVQVLVFGFWITFTPDLSGVELPDSKLYGAKLRYRSFTLFRLHARWIFTLGLSVSSAVDVLITGLLVYLFQKNRTGSGRFNHVLDKLILYGLETGSLTCLGTIIAMLLWVIPPNNLIFLGVHVVIGKLYSTSLLVTLNTRNNIQRQPRPPTCTCNEQRTPVLYLEPRTQKVSGQYLDGPSNKVPAELQINVQTQTNVHYDGASIASSK
ncbi:hypothetical protein DFH06DRAFT_1438792 [Mycena polygramma]|nr:hypothetical protein DFH06DRAFT_1438792 [Mycena polygramma]